MAHSDTDGDDRFRVDDVDHVELFVTDWEAATAWYDRVLGLTPDERFARWSETRDGPLVLTAGEGSTKLALFERETATRGRSISPRRVAFRTGGEGFLWFLDRLDDLDLTDAEGDPVTAADAVDHRLSYSIYFTDPDGTLLELTTNEYEAVSEGLDRG